VAFISSLFAVLCAIFGSAVALAHVGVVDSLEAAGFSGATTQARALLIVGVVCAAVTDLVGVAAALTLTGHTAAVLFGKHGCCRRSVSGKDGSTIYGVTSRELLRRGLRVEWGLWALAYASVVLMLCATVRAVPSNSGGLIASLPRCSEPSHCSSYYCCLFLSTSHVVRGATDVQMAIAFCWTLITFLTGVCGSKDTTNFALVLHHSPASFLGTTGATSVEEWDLGLRGFCSSALEACVDSDAVVREHSMSHSHLLSPSGVWCRWVSQVPGACTSGYLHID
jgi:hypothetical protein